MVIPVLWKDYVRELKVREAFNQYLIHQDESKNDVTTDSFLAYLGEGKIVTEQQVAEARKKVARWEALLIDRENAKAVESELVKLRPDLKGNWASYSERQVRKIPGNPFGMDDGGREGVSKSDMPNIGSAGTGALVSRLMQQRQNASGGRGRGGDTSKPEKPKTDE